MNDPRDNQPDDSARPEQTPPHDESSHSAGESGSPADPGPIERGRGPADPHEMTEGMGVAQPAPPPPESERLHRSRGRGRQMLKNLVTNFMTIGVQLILGMLLTRYLIRTLGPAEYGVVPLSFQLMNFFSLITMVVNSSVGRYLTMEMAADDLQAARRTFNSSFWGMMMVFALLLPVAAGIAYYSPRLFNFAEGAEAASQRVLVSVMLSFFTLVTSSTLMVTTFARNRLDLQNYVRMLWHIVRVATPFILIGWFGWGLDGVSVGIVLSAALHLVWSIYLWRHLNPELRLSPKLFSKSRFKELTGMSVWLMLDKIGRILAFAGSIVVVNLVLGPAAAGKYGAIMVFARAMILYNRSMRRVATPVIYQMFGNENYIQVRRFLISFVRFEGVMMALPLGLLIMLAEPLIGLWLGWEYTELAPVLVWMMVGLILTMPMVAVRTVFAATRAVKHPGIWSMAIGIINLILMVYLLDPGWGLGLGLVSVPIAMLVTTQLKNFFFVPLYAAKLMKLPWWTFFRPMTRITASYAFLLLLAWGLSRWIDPHTWIGLTATVLIISVIYLPVGLFVFLTKGDRQHVRQLRRRRRRPRSEDDDADRFMDDGGDF